jgi:hypothetical protein
MLIIISVYFIIVAIIFLSERSFDIALRLAIMPSIFFGLIASALCSGLIPDYTYKVAKTETLACLQDGNSTSGSFFLGCGTINGTMKYTYYAKDEDGYVLRQEVADEDVKIKYTNDVPHIDKLYPRLKNRSLIAKLTFFPLASVKTIFYIPQGSIKQDYTLDAK